jgi:hypothetical protein
MQKDEDMILHVHGIRVRLTDIQTLQRILVSTKRLVFSLHLLAVDQLVCQTIAASVARGPILDKGERQYFS